MANTTFIYIACLAVLCEFPFTKKTRFEIGFPKWRRNFSRQRTMSHITPQCSHAHTNRFVSIWLCSFGKPLAQTEAGCWLDVRATICGHCADCVGSFASSPLFMCILGGMMIWSDLRSEQEEGYVRRATIKCRAEVGVHLLYSVAAGCDRTQEVKKTYRCPGTDAKQTPSWGQMNAVYTATCV